MRPISTHSSTQTDDCPVQTVQSMSAEPLAAHQRIQPTSKVTRQQETSKTDNLNRVKVVVCAGTDKAGDQNQAAGIMHFLLEAVDTLEITKADTLDDSLSTQLTLLQEQLDNNEIQKAIILIAGCDSLALQALSLIPVQKNISVIQTAHQYSDIMLETTRKPDVLALPKSSINEVLTREISSQEGTLLLPLSGVPHNIHTASLSLDSKNFTSTCLPPEAIINDDITVLDEKGTQRFFNTRIPEIDSNTIAVILPGDAPDLNGEQKLFIPEHARALARRIITAENQKLSDTNELTPRKVIVTNGPRTGKFSTNNEALAHRTGISDSVTQAFIDELNNHQVETTLLDFQFNALPSGYKPLLHAFLTAEEKGTFYVAGESTSMVSEASSLLKVTVIDAESMNTSHTDFVDSVVQQGLASRLKLDGTMVDSSSTTGETKPHPKLAAKVVADTIIQKLLS